MKKLLHNITRWLVKKTKYELQLPIQPIIIKPEDLKKFHAQHIINWYEWNNTPLTPDCFVQQFKYELVDKLLKEIQIKVKETPSGVIYSCDLLLKSI